MKSFEQASAESTCQKRITICEIYDVEGNLLSRESNRCNPTGGICHRLGVVQQKTNYDTGSACNWLHAEMNAIAHLKEGKPYRAVIYGHTFFCNSCENALRSVGVKELEIK